MGKKRSENSNKGASRRNTNRPKNDGLTRLKANAIREIEKPIFDGDTKVEMIQVKQEIEETELIQPDAEELDSILRLSDVKTEPLEDIQGSNYANGLTETDDFTLNSVVVKEEYVLSYPDYAEDETSDVSVGMEDYYEYYTSIGGDESTKTDVTSTNKKKHQPNAAPTKRHRQYECFACRKPFATESSLRIHMKKSCFRKFECEICHQRFKCRAYLNTHQMTHMEEAVSEDGQNVDNNWFHKSNQPKRNQFSCPKPDCHKKFSRKDRLTVHMRVHSNIRPYVCEEIDCGKRFTEWSNLDKHSRIHRGDKPFACNAAGCTKQFAAKCNLIEHKRTHSGEQPFVCLVAGCGKRYTHRRTFSKHSMVHSGEKPFECDEPGCGKSFHLRYYLNRHKTIHR